MFRYKEECEDACLADTKTTTSTQSAVTKERNDVGFLDVGNGEIEEVVENNHVETYGTNKPIRETTPTYEQPKSGVY